MIYFLGGQIFFSSSQVRLMLIGVGFGVICSAISTYWTRKGVTRRIVQTEKAPAAIGPYRYPNSFSLN